MHITNLFEDIPAQLPEEISQTLLTGAAIRIERIVSRGQSSPEGFWYDQSEHEWVLVLAGSAGLQIEGDEHIRTLKPGDFLLLPAHQKHRVAWIESDAETIWLAVFYS